MAGFRLALTTEITDKVDGFGYVDSEGTKFDMVARAEAWLATTKEVTSARVIRNKDNVVVWEAKR